MTGLIRAELLKLRSTRTFWAITIGALALAAIAVSATSAFGTFTPGDQPVRHALALAGPVQTFALLLGVLAVTNEFRHATITPALLITPKRTPLLVAKLITLTVGGLILGLLAFGTAVAIVLPVFAARHVAGQIDGAGVAGIVAGGATVTGLCAALGVGLGAVIRNQVGAVIATLCLLYVVEPLLSLVPHVDDTVQRFGLGGLANGASGTSGFPSDTNILGQIPAVAVLAAYAFAIVACGGLLSHRRDLTA